MILVLALRRVKDAATPRYQCRRRRNGRC